MRIFKKVMKVIFIIGLVGSLLGVIGIGTLYFLHKDDINKSIANANQAMEQLENSKLRTLEPTQVYSNKNELIGEVSSSNYEHVNIKDVSKYVYDGYIAVEDRNFKTHNGVDYKAVFRAGISLVSHKGEITQGGSTITQQVIKNNVLSSERTFKRKILEMILAPKLEKSLSKDEIMEIYVNSNFYGNNCDGIQSAANYYFGKDAKELTLAEAATLVGTSNSPSACNPKTNYELSLEKRHRVLDQMLSCDYITKSEYDIAYDEKLDLTLVHPRVVGDTYAVTYAIRCAALNLMRNDGFEFKYTFDSSEDYSEYKEKFSDIYGKRVSSIREGGYTIKTSIDLGKQSLLQQSVIDGLSGFNKVAPDGKLQVQGAAVSIDNKSGYVVAVVGGRDPLDELNRAYQTARQSGSTAKPFTVYMPAFSTGKYYPSYKILDSKEDKGPKNVDEKYRGKMPIREAIARSTNTVAFKLIRVVGVDKAVKTLDSLHISTLSYLDNNNNALALGGFTYGVTVSDWCRAYNTIANGGTLENKDCLLSLKFAGSNEELCDEGKSSKRVFSEDVAYLMIDCLKDVARKPYGGGYRVQLKDMPMACKTGTTNDNKDAWFAGLTKYYTTVVWVGCDTPTTVTGLYGSSYPSYIWKEYMASIHTGLASEDWVQSKTIVEQHIDYNGAPTSRRTSQTDIFSTLSVDELSIGEYSSAELAAEALNKANASKIALAKETLTEISTLEVYDVNDALELKALIAKYKSTMKNIPTSVSAKGTVESSAVQVLQNAQMILDAWNKDMQNYAEEKAKAAAEAKSKAKAEKEAAEQAEALANSQANQTATENQPAVETPTQSNTAELVRSIQKGTAALANRDTSSPDSQYQIDYLEGLMSTLQSKPDFNLYESDYNNLRSDLDNAEAQFKTGGV